MAGYKLVTFDGVALPEYDPETDLTPAPVLSTLQRSIGGVFDRWGSNRRLPDQHVIEYTGIYLGEVAYVVDHDGAYLVDHNGDNWIYGDSETWLRTQIDALVEKEGVRGQLVRRRFDDSVNQWKQARLLSVTWQAEHEHRTVIAKVTPRFEIAKGAWRDESATTSSKTLIAGSVGLNIENGGMQRIDDAVITVTATSAITSLTVTKTSGIDWTFSGTIAAGTSLVIDCGAQTILNNGSNAYSDFALGSGHTVEGWLPLEKGVNALVIQSDEAGTFSVEHYDQWL